jgi:hypothetical protein
VRPSQLIHLEDVCLDRHNPSNESNLKLGGYSCHRSDKEDD